MRWSVSAACRLFGVLFAFACAAPVAADAGTDRVRVAGSGWIVDAPTRIADRLGLFSAHAAELQTSGIDAVYADSGQQALHWLLEGDVQFALAAPAPVALALLEREPGASDPVVLASVGLSNQSHYLVVPAESGIGSPDELRGRRLGVPLGTSAHFVWTRFALQAGLAEADVELVDLAIADHARGLADGSVDAVLGWDPWAAELVDQLGEGASRMLLEAPYAVDWLLVTTRAQLQRDPAAAAAVLRAYLEANELIARDPDEARAVHAEARGVLPAALEPLEVGVIWDLALGWRVLAGIEAQFDWLAPGNGARPAPRRYLAAGPLLQVAPEAVTIPPYLYDDSF